MKAFVVASTIVLLAAVGAKPDLNQLLAERAEINQQYKREFVAAAKEARNAKLLARFEAGVADSWLELIAHAKNSEDDQLKRIVLRLEYYDELRSYCYDKEYAENPDQVREATDGLKLYSEKLETVEVVP